MADQADQRALAAKCAEAEQRLLAAAKELESRMKERGIAYPPYVVSRLRWKLGNGGDLPSHWIFSDDPGYAPYQKAEEHYKNALAALKDEICKPPAMPEGWEGEPWQKPFEHLADVAAYINDAKQHDSDMVVAKMYRNESGQIAAASMIVRNVYLALSHLAVYDRPARPAAATTMREAEGQLSDLRAWVLRTVDAGDSGRLVCDATNLRHNADDAEPAQGGAAKVGDDPPATPPKRRGRKPKDPPLPHRCNFLLQAMLNLGATTQAERQTQRDIFEKAEGKHADGDCRASFTRLKTDGLIDVAKGPNGGCWLTASGRQLAETLCGGDK